MPAQDKAGSGKRQEIPGGWIKAARSIRHHSMLRTAMRKGVWFDLLLRVADEPKRVILRTQFVDLEAGQCAVFMSEWAKTLKITPRQLKRIMESWRSQGAVSFGRVPGKAYSLITIKDYRFDQASPSRAGEV